MERSEAFVADLERAKAALRQEPEALKSLCALIDRLVQDVARRFSLPQGMESELSSTVRAHVLVGLDEDAPALSAYSGAGPLHAWLKTTVVRTALNLRRALHREQSFPSVERDSLALPDADPEMELMRRRFRAAFPRALESAMAQLHSRDRLLLKLHHLDGLSTDRIAKMYGTHRVTITRWLVSARQEILAHTRRALAIELNAPEAELDSWMRLMRSRLSVSVRRVLGGEQQ
ncbi:MAG: sigma-70 family RNA polymerase sigma factor [Myxococcaceae bacterium]